MLINLTRANETIAIGADYLARVERAPAGGSASYLATLYRRTGKPVDGGEGLDYVRSAYGEGVDQALRELHVEVVAPGGISVEVA